MPRKKAMPRFYGTADIMVMLGVSYTTASALMHQFEKRGQMLRFGKSMRVAIPVFEEWVNEHMLVKK